MGSVASVFRREKPALSFAEQQLEESRLKSMLEFKILLLGAGECGKSTVLKQVRLVHKIGFTEQELKDFGANLRHNTINSMKALIDACSTVNPPILIEDETLKAHCDNVISFEFSDELYSIPSDIVTSVEACWASQPIRDVWERRSEYWCLDSVDYYFERLHVFVESDYVPDEQDCVMARIITTGIVTTVLESPPVSFELIDVGGQRNERRKWMHTFDNVTAIFYLVNLGGYASVLYEDKTVNRMMEDLELFATTLNTQLFSNTPIYLIFNKKDLFEMMLRKVPLTNCFPDYKGSSENVIDAIEYLTTIFKDKLTKHKAQVKAFAIAARYRKDVKTVWEEIADDLKHMKAKDIQEATKGLANLAKTNRTKTKEKKCCESETGEDELNAKTTAC